MHALQFQNENQDCFCFNFQAESIQEESREYWKCQVKECGELQRLESENKVCKTVVLKGTVGAQMWWWAGILQAWMYVYIQRHMLIYPMVKVVRKRVVQQISSWGIGVGSKRARASYKNVKQLS